MIDVQRLRVFRAVVASGSVQAAADHLGYTPSAVSQQIAALQRETGLVLFERAGRGISPTASAKVLAAESEEVMGSLSRLGGVVEHLRDGYSGSLAIGTFASAAQMWLPHVAKGLQREFPDLVVELSLDELGSAGHAPPQRRDIDVTTEAADAPGTERVGYERLVLVEESYRVAIPKGHELLKLYDGPVPMAALADVAMIDADFSDTGCAVIVRNACRAAGFTPRYVARSDDHHTALAFVAGRIGVTLLPELAVDEAMPGFESRELVSPAPRRRVVAFVRDSSALSPPVRRAVELLAEAVAKTVARRGVRSSA
ncbi:MAG TPA: LysR family transcriptional regulator [Nocardioides sp.]|uniref:LysR family transcriptional regulator n=1 Tax=Nocardioides sp. TaxID=35761 RepID=UPI002E3337CD|nr:LysR family transcriptional regulator [Nocardioides sp.]HEX3930298.1 LysR family transcriptional regulator [Nocardioides sp.]